MFKLTYTYKVLPCLPKIIYYNNSNRIQQKAPNFAAILPFSMSFSATHVASSPACQVLSHAKVKLAVST